jgi:Protein of unknown function (DUF2934)
MRGDVASERITKMRANTAAEKINRTALLAYEFWRARGCPDGSSELDWFLAEEQLKHQHDFTMAQAA